jgi:hypothetical protein
MSEQSGKIVEVISGTHKGQTGVALNSDQKPETVKAGKIIVELRTGKKLIDYSRLKVIGYQD